MAWGTTVPAVKAALASIFDAALDVTVMQSRGIGSTAKRDILVVGYQSEDVPAVEGRFTVEIMGANPLRDQYVIHNRIMVAKGSTDILKAEARAFAILAAAGSTLAGNPRLNNTPSVLIASLGSYSLVPSQSPGSGAFIALQFDVEVDAYTTV
jgi:hypothetical protein